MNLQKLINKLEGIKCRRGNIPVTIYADKKISASGEIYDRRIYTVSWEKYTKKKGKRSVSVITK